MQPIAPNSATSMPQHRSPPLESLTADLELPAAKAGAKRPGSARPARALQRWSCPWQRSDQARVTWAKWSRRLGPVAVLALAAGAWLIWGPMFKPDYTKDNLNRVFKYTLLTDEFNKLPIEERLKLLGQLVARLKGMSAGDSALMAAFAAGVGGAAREQLEENASKLAIDLWDKYALNYKDVAAEDRDAWLDGTFIEFTKTMELLTGQPRDVSDQERLAEGKRQAERDMERMRERPPSARQMGNMLNFMRNTVGEHAAPQQRARGQTMLIDMTRRLRGGSAAGPR
jgi:hypothetical protein